MTHLLCQQILHIRGDENPISFTKSIESSSLLIRKNSSDTSRIGLGLPPFARNADTLFPFLRTVIYAPILTERPSRGSNYVNALRELPQGKPAIERFLPYVWIAVRWPKSIRCR